MRHYVKTQVILYMFETLKETGLINPEQVKKDFHLNEKTFLRYISELRSYLCNFSKGMKIVYHRSKKNYFLEPDSL